MPRVRKSNKSTQPNSSVSRPRTACKSQGLELRSKADIFIDHAKKAELAIRENYNKGRIPPDWCGDGWDDEFNLAYKSIRDHLPRFASKYYRSPPGTAHQSFPFDAENPVQAWMFLLNPADMAFGELGYLESTEYQEIKNAAFKILDNSLNPPLEHTLTETQNNLVRATDQTPRPIKEIAKRADCDYQAARKYLPNLRRDGYVQKAEKNGYYRLD